MDEKTYKQTLHEILNNDYCGIETFVEKVLEPIFKPYVGLFSAPVSIRATMNHFCFDGLYMGEIEIFSSNFSSPIYIYDVAVSDNSFTLENAQENLPEFLSKDYLYFVNAFIILHDEDIKNRCWRFYFAQKSEKYALKESSFAMGQYSNSKTLEEKLCNLFANRDNITGDLISQTFLQESK